MGGVAGSNGGSESLGAGACLSTDDVLAHLDRRLEGPRLQTVRDHLDGCGACRVVMAEAARLATSAAGGARVPRTLADGESVAGRYQIRRFIARGGMGEVYEAFDSALGETIALKTITVTAVDQADAVKRLLAEVRIARKVTHPNVCRILEFGTHRRPGSADDAVPFLTMPLLQGETLARRLQSVGRLPAREALRVLGELAAGLAAVHEVGVVHRDFKSDNVFLVKGDDGGERAVVMDFGLARALEAQGDANKTTGRVLIGTPAYMAPEQVEGKRVTKAVDVYAYGVVAFEVITGRVPFTADSPAAIALARLQRVAAPPSSLVPELGKAWDGVVQRCLRRAPQHRYPSMTEVTGALELLRAGVRRRSWRSVRALVLAVAVVTLAAWTAARRSRPSAAARTLAVAAPQAAAATAPQPTAHAAAVPNDAAQTAPAGAIKHERSAARAKRSVAAPISSPSPSPPAPSSDAEGQASAERALARPAAPRPRQPDDLVDPF